MYAFVYLWLFCPPGTVSFMWGKSTCSILHHTATAEASDMEAEVGAGLGVAVVN